MEEYHKIDSLYIRGKDKKMIFGTFSNPLFEFLNNNVWEFTEKLNGTNIRINWNNFDINFSGKTNNSQIPSKLVDYLIKKFYDKKKLFLDMFSEKKVEIFGEGIGCGISEPDGSKYNVTKTGTGVDFVIFDIKINDSWLNREQIEDISVKFDVPFIPIFGYGNLSQLFNLVKNGFKSRFGDLIAEGIVARPKIELKDKDGKRIITKLKYKDFPEDLRGKVNI